MGARGVAFVLVHGGGMTAGYWDRLLPHLRHPALAVELPGRAGRPSDPMTRTVAECAASVVADVRAADLGDVVLVAHSSGGLVVPGVAAAIAPAVRHIVLSAASVPPEGGTGLDCMKPSHRARVEEAMAAARGAGRTLTTPGAPADLDAARAMFPDVDPDALELLAAPERWAEDSMHVYFQPVSWAQVSDVPVTYVKNLRDRAVPPALQDEMAARLPQARVVELDSDHHVAVTRPEAFAAIVEDIADRYG